MKITEVVAALIWQGEKFMICQRPAHKARGLLWEFVCGKVEPGETKEQALAAKLQAHITANYYTCTDEILSGLGKMYVADERFKNNIDKYGERTAEFAAEAIAAYCKTI